MKIQHYTFSETGGAGRVAKTLVAEQRRMGIDSSVDTFLHFGLARDPLSHPALTLAAATDKWVVTRAGVPNLTSLFRSKISLLKPSQIDSASVYHLHWMEGVANSKSYDWLGRLGTPVVWTLHDSRPFTGFCHLPGACKGYQAFCRSCPQAKSSFHAQISNGVLDARRALAGIKKLALVAPSTWLAEQARSSRIFSGRKIEVIANPIDNAFFNSRVSRAKVRNALGLGVDEVIGVVIAENLLDPVKRVVEIAREFSRVSATSTKTLRLLLIGRGGSALGHISRSIIPLGPLDRDALIDVLSEADYLISGSIAESAGQTISEAGALGLPSLVASGSGSETQVSPERSGLVFRNFEELGGQIMRIVSQPDLRMALGAEAKIVSEGHRASVVATKYQDIYKSLLDQLR